MSFVRLLPLTLALLGIQHVFPAGVILGAQQRNPEIPPTQATQSPAPKESPGQKPLFENEELQQAIDRSGNDRAALVRNLEGFLKDFPESGQRARIYRALVEADMQLRDSVHAADYAERIIALNPEDIPMTLLAIQLLESVGDEAALRRALSYSSRVLDYVNNAASQPKPSKLSVEEWAADQKQDKMSIFAMRGRLYFKLHDYAAAEREFRTSMAASANAAVAEKLGEIAELNKDMPGAIREYAKAFALADSSGKQPNRREIRQKLGNVWRLAHGSDQGLGDYLLQAYDDVAASTDAPKPKRNAGAKEAYAFSLRKAQDGSPYLLADKKGKIVVLNFWATWCGPCRALEPHYERVAAQFQGIADIVFLAADCDEDETLVPGYLAEAKPTLTVVFADGLDSFLVVKSYPTVIVLDRAGKIAYRAEGFDPDDVESELTSAVRRTLAAQKPSGSGENAAQGVKSAP